MKRKLLMLIVAVAIAVSSRAQTTPTHVTGTFKTPGNQTPAQAGLKQIATIVSTAVYGSVDFEPWDQGANRPTTLLCGGVTYPPQKVHTWIKGDATIVDDAAAAGKDLIPNAGCLPTGAVYRATIYFAPSSDGRVPAITIYQYKTIPAQASVDWGSLSLAALTSTAYSYQTQSAAVILDYEDYTGIATPANPAAGKCRIYFDTAAGKIKGRTSTGADCNPAGAGGGSQHQVNAVNLLANDPVNFQNDLAIIWSNPSAGNVRAGLRVAAGCATTANGDLCFDSTAARWKIWQTANRELIASTNIGASGQPCLSNADGSCTFADPIVSGPTAVGAAPATNPVYVAGLDGTNIRPFKFFDLDSGAGTDYNLGITLRKSASGGSVELGTAADPVRTDPTGTTNQPVTVAAALPTGSNKIGNVDVASITAVTATGTITALNGAVTISVGGYGAVGIQLSGTWTATALFEATVDGTNWQAIEAWPTNSATSATSSTANGVWHVPTGGLNQIRVRGNPFTSGTITVDLRATTAAAKMLAAGGTGGTSSSFGAAFPGTGTAVGVKATAAAPTHVEGNMVGLSVDLGGLARVRCDSGCAGASDTSATGTITAAAGAVQVVHAGQSSVGLLLSGTWVATLTPQVSFDGGTTWVATALMNPTSGAIQATTTANGSFVIVGTAGAGHARVTATAFTSGTVNVTLRSVASTDNFIHADLQQIGGANYSLGQKTMANSAPVALASDQPAIPASQSGTWTVQPGNTANTTAWLMDVSDRAARVLGQIEGRAASGAAKAGNPIQVGGVFNTTQPTVATGQAVEAQATARGELLIAKGVSGFSIDNTGFNVTGSLPAGTNNIGGVNVAQVAGTATSVNGGNIDAGTIRVAAARNADVCNSVDAQQVAVSVAASGSTELVALTAGQTIYLCDILVKAGGTVDVKFVYGTGVACATGPVDMTGAGQEVAQTGWAISPEGRLKTAAANALCINLSAAISVRGFITYRKAATF